MPRIIEGHNGKRAADGGGGILRSYIRKATKGPLDPTDSFFSLPGYGALLKHVVVCSFIYYSESG
jgi:hypothetical protein